MDLNSLRKYLETPDQMRVLEKIAAWLDGGELTQFYRINPALLAQKLQTSEELVLDVFLAGVLTGFFELRWDFHCPHCHGTPNAARHLHEIKSHSFCAPCSADFRNTLDENVEVTFTISTKVGLIPPEWVNQQIALMVKQIQEGTYTLPGAFTTGLSLVHRPLFAREFSADVLALDESLEIKGVTFLFTDIKGSTALYEQLGDVGAFALVNEHFKLLFEDVEKSQGVVVKTIGDAVMASFKTPSAALQAALNIQDRISQVKIPSSQEPLVVKMGIHGGPAVAVTLNQRFDYFGQTVNKAARIQSLAFGQEVFFSEAVFQDPESRRLLARRKKAVHRHKTMLKGIENEQVVYSVR